MRLHEILERAIIDGTLPAGERIHADEIAAQYGVSRIPVREALRSLHAAGWVEIRPRLGVKVRQRTPSELTELFELRAAIEGMVARWAAERRTQDDLDALVEAVAQSREARDLGDDEALLRAAAGFYEKLRAAAHNAVLEATSAALEKRARFYYSTTAHDHGRDWVHVHEQLLDMVSHQMAEQAARLAEQNILRSSAAVRELLFPGE
jgi:DNA-binding GntR family transcriptional regulator